MNQALFSGSIGVNNKVAPHRLPFGKDGVNALESATDVLIDKTGAVVSARGRTTLLSDHSHSGWATSGGFYLIQDREDDSALYKAHVSGDGSIELTGIRDLARGARASFADLDGKTLYSNGYQHGILDGVNSSDWPVSEWNDTETSVEMTQMPIGKHIDILSGRAIVSVGNEIIYSEYGKIGITSLAHNIARFEGNVIMVVSVNTGVFVSTETSIYFLAGADPKKWSIKKVLDYPAIEYSRNQTLVNPSFFGLETVQLSALFGTTHGAVIGLPDGTAVNLIDKQITLPTNCGNGAIMVVDETTILQS